jgi:hypothetical protein
MMRDYLGGTLEWKKDFDDYECSCWTWNIFCSIKIHCKFLILSNIQKYIVILRTIVDRMVKYAIDEDWKKLKKNATIEAIKFFVTKLKLALRTHIQNIQPN